MPRAFAGYDALGNVMPHRPAMKPLFIEASPHGQSDSTDLKLVFGQREIGTVTVHLEDFAEFLEALRAGFTWTIIRRKEET